MYRKLILIAALIVLVATSMQAQHKAHSTTSKVGWPPAPTAKFIASTEKTFGDLMANAMDVMHRDMHNAEYSGDADYDFVTMMIPHHQGAMEMAKALLHTGKETQMRRLAQEVITDELQ